MHVDDHVFSIKRPKASSSKRERRDEVRTVTQTESSERTVVADMTVVIMASKYRTTKKPHVTETSE